MSTREMDLLIKNVTIIDGTFSPSSHGNLAIKGDKIVGIGSFSCSTFKKVINGKGLTATPGFIDIHSHSDFTLTINPLAESKVRQGVTTEVTGQCGQSPAPVNQKNRNYFISLSPYLSWKWSTFDEYLKYLAKIGHAVNVIPLIGHGALRSSLMGFSNLSPTHMEMKKMKEILCEAMDNGAWGFSTGLIYPPGCYTSTDEIMELAKVVAKRCGFYFTHLRGEGSRLLSSIKEAVKIGEETGVRVQISHLKVQGKENHHLLIPSLNLIERAKERGLNISADSYPYIASSTVLSRVLPYWVFEGGSEKMVRRLQQDSLRKRILRELQASKISWNEVIIAQGKGLSQYEGLSIATISKKEGKDPAILVLDLLSASEEKISAIYFNISENNLKLILKHPKVMIGSDGWALNPDGPLGEGKEHPRNYGAFPRVLGKYVRLEQTLSLEEAIYKMTGFPAFTLGLKDRGLIKEGYKADLVLFNSETIEDRATFSKPYQYPKGIEYVFVNGKEVITPEGHTGALPGKILSPV